MDLIKVNENNYVVIKNIHSISLEYVPRFCYYNDSVNLNTSTPCYWLLKINDVAYMFKEEKLAQEKLDIILKEIKNA